jgi:hypothetical protein
MKKIVLSLAVMAGVCISANAGNMKEEVNAGNEIVIAGMEEPGDGYVEVKLEELNEHVKKAIEAYQETDTVKIITYNAEKKLTKVIFVSRADGSEKEVIFDEEGKTAENK